MAFTSVGMGAVAMQNSASCSTGAAVTLPAASLPIGNLWELIKDEAGSVQHRSVFKSLQRSTGLGAYPVLAWNWLREEAPLHGLLKENFPDDQTFWCRWALCPWAVNAILLKGHFWSESRALCATMIADNCGSIVANITQPRRALVRASLYRRNL